MKQTDIMDTLRELKDMFLAGAISEEEFQSLKMEFLQKQNLLPVSQNQGTPAQPMATTQGSVPVSKDSTGSLAPKQQILSQRGDVVARGIPVATSKSISSDKLIAAEPGFVHKTPPILQGVEPQLSLTPSHGMPASIPVADRQQEFMRLYTEATQQAAIDPQGALGKLAQAQQLAPELCDDVFRQWEQYGLYVLQQKQEEAAAQQRVQAEAHKKAQEQALLQSVVTPTPVPKHSLEAPPLLGEEEWPGKSGESTNPGFEMPRSQTAQTAEPEPDEPASILLSGINDLLAEEDFLGAFDLLEHLMPKYPESKKIRMLYQMCRQQVEQFYQERFVNLENLYPALTCSMQELLTLVGQLDHRSGFLASQLNGATSIEDLVSISGLDDFAVLRFLDRLQQRNLLRF